MATKPKLDADLSSEPVDQTDYSSKIGSLMYLTSSRPDTVQAVCYCVRYQAKPTEKHLKEVKRIFRYLRGTIHMGLWYPKGSGFELTAFSDADHAGCIETRKSTSGGTQFLGDKWKRISHKRTKNKAKNDKTKHGMEKCEKTKPNRSQKSNSQSQSQPRQSQSQKKVKAKKNIIEGPKNARILKR
ncbi:hypothetical protein Tco_0873350 [Tanacetum coccineum]